jgi:hypothetical protein
MSSLAAVFEEEVDAHDGMVVDMFTDEECLYGRAVLPRTEMIVPDDGVKGGVAMRAADGEIWVHPYVFRLVCRNGLIAPSAFSTRYLNREDLHGQSQVLEFIREAISACCSDAQLVESVEKLKGARDVEADLLLTLASLSSRISGDLWGRLLKSLMDSPLIKVAKTLFDTVNQFTSVARDMPKPRDRWDLEELAGRMLSDPNPRPPVRSEAAAVRSTVGAT